jgi:drug/metabolite transporter (DMT)-like permease
MPPPIEPSTATDPVLPAGLTAEGTQTDAFGSQEWALLFAAGAIWGASFLQIAEALEGFHPFAVTFARIVIGALTLAVVPASRVRLPRSAWPRIAAVSVTWLAFPMTLFPIAQQHVSSSLAGMLNGAIPVFAAVVATLLLRRLPGNDQLWALALGLLGVVLVGSPTLGEGGSSALGVVLVLVAVASYGVAVNLAVPLTQAYGAVPVFWRCQLVAAALTAPLGVHGLVDSDFGWRPSVFLVSLGVFGTAIAFVMMTTLTARVGATRGSTLTYVEAVAALALGVAVRGERVRPIEFVGCGVLLAGAWLAGRTDSRRVQVAVD